MRLVYLTSGRSRTLQLTDGQTLQFVHTSLKNLAFHNRTAMLVTFALKEIGKDNLTEEQKEHILQLLKQEDPESLKRDLSLMPDWIQMIIQQAL